MSFQSSFCYIRIGLLDLSNVFIGMPFLTRFSASLTVITAAFIITCVMLWSVAIFLSVIEAAL